MLPMWLMIAQGVKQIADNQNEQANTQANNTQSNNTQSNNTQSNAGSVGSAFSTISSIYNNYLSDDKDKKKNWFSQIFGNR